MGALVRLGFALAMLCVLPGVSHAEPAPQVRADVLLVAQVGPVDVQVFIPRQAETVRGLIIHAANYKLKDDDKWAELCRQMRFAHVAMNIENVQKATNRHQNLAKALEGAMKQFADRSGHAELTRLPWVGVGHSAGGLVTGVLLREPGRTITNCVDCGWVMDSAKLSPEAASVPALFTMGAVADDFKMLPAIEANFEPARRKGLPWGLGVQWGCAHDFGNSAALMIPWIHAITRARLPGDGSTPHADAAPALQNVKLEDGWLGDRSTVDGNFATIAPWAEYQGDKTVAVWFPDRAFASVWRAWQSKDAPLTVEASAAGGAGKLPPWGPKVARDLIINPGIGLVLGVTVKPGAPVSKVVFYDADSPIGDGAAAGGWRLNWNVPAAGFHVVYAQWETTDGKQGVTNPALVIVRTR